MPWMEIKMALSQKRQGPPGHFDLSQSALSGD